jgi:hypothetical protein
MPAENGPIPASVAAAPPRIPPEQNEPNRTPKNENDKTNLTTSIGLPPRTAKSLHPPPPTAPSAARTKRTQPSPENENDETNPIALIRVPARTAKSLHPPPPTAQSAAGTKRTHPNQKNKNDETNLNTRKEAHPRSNQLPAAEPAPPYESRQQPAQPKMRKRT